MKNLFKILLLLLCADSAGWAQSFTNLNFESATISDGGYTAVVSGWTYGGNYNYVNGDPNSIPFNNFALDAAAVNLEGTNNPIGLGAIQGNYSIFIQGGSRFDPETNGASIMQTGRIPSSANSITYWGGPLEVTFNGQALAFNAVGSGPGYNIWQANISAYAGQTGELEFAAPWQTSALLDNIQFSPGVVPEPGTLALGALGGAWLVWRMWKKS